MDKYNVVALMGKAGSGKDRVLKEIMARYPYVFNEIISCTTRPPRQGEVDGVNYHFLLPSQFADKVLSGEMLESCQFNHWFYGTPESSLSNEKINIGVFNPNGIYCLQEDSRINLFVYCLRAPAKVRLLRQLQREENPDVKEIIRRYDADEDDFYDLSEIKDYTELNNVNEEDISLILDKIRSDLSE